MRRMLALPRDLILFSALATSTGADADPIHDAVMAGDTAQIVRLLEGGANVDAADPMGTPLQLALFVNQLDAARLLLDRGANPNVTGATGTPLQTAARSNNGELVGLLLSLGADPNLGDGARALAIAAQSRNTVVVDLLLEHGAEPSAATDQGMTALHEAARAGSLEIVRALIERGADVNALASLGRPPIHFAMERNHKAVAAYLKENGSEPHPVEPIAHLLASADIVAGEEEVQNCAGCHPLEPKRNNFGPSLWNVVGREIGSIADFSYSKAFSELEGIWSFDALNRFIARPRDFVPGTKMELAGIEEPTRRANVIAYLRTLSDDPVPVQ